MFICLDLSLRALSAISGAVVSYFVIVLTIINSTANLPHSTCPSNVLMFAIIYVIIYILSIYLYVIVCVTLRVGIVRRDVHNSWYYL